MIDQNLDKINQEFFSEFFNDYSVEYLEKSAGSRWFKYLLKSTLSYIKPGSIKKVADVGCGIGHKTSIIKESFPKAAVDGFDFSEPAINVANKAYGKQGLKYSCEDITKKSYKKKFDLVCAFDVLEHVDKWEKLAKDLCESSNKYVLFSFPVGRMRPYEVHIGHYRNFQKGQIEEFMKKNKFKVVHTYYAGFPFFSPITRDLTNIMFKQYSGIANKKMGLVSKLIHDIWYILYRYFSAKHRGDVFIGLFEKE